MFKNLFKSSKSVYVAAAVIAVAVSVILILCFSALIYFTDIDRKYIPFFSTLSLAAGCFVSSMWAARHIGEKGYLTGLIIGSICFFIITLAGFIIGERSFSFNTLFHFVIIILSGITGGIAGVNRKKDKII